MGMWRYVLLALCLSPSAFGQSAGTRHIEPSDASILKADTDLFRQHVSTLSNPFFEGRQPGTRGNRLAADYIEFHVRRLGLLPAFDTSETLPDGTQVVRPRTSYRQEFDPRNARPPFGRITPTRQDFRTIIGDTGLSLRPGEDFAVLGYSGSGQVEAPLAFAGYSVAEGKDGYTTYPKPDALKGRVALVLRFEPMDERGKSRWADVRWSAAAALDTKLRAAAEAGAEAILLVNPPGAADDRAADDRLEGTALAGRALRIPVLQVTRRACDEIIRRADPQGRSLADLRAWADEHGGVIDLSGATVSLDVQIERPSLRTDNVGAVLPGRGTLRDEWIIIGSHYDHVGYGPVGAREQYYGQIHPGADDNASGSSGNLLVAQRLARMYRAEDAPTDARSVLFLWFSAEEGGLDGSRHFVNNPSVPLDKVSLMINMDMIGRLRERQFEVGGLGSAHGLMDWASPYFESFGMPVRPNRIGADNSDHYSFKVREVPYLFFFTGLHREYHTPADTADTINFEGGARVADLVARIAFDAAVRAERFTFASDGPESPEPEPAPGPVGGVRVRFGIMPGDYSSGDGVVIGDLSGDDLPAAKAGLRAGDRMIRWNGRSLTTVESWMPLLSAHKPGDEVEIVYVRDGKEYTTKATLVAPSARPRQ
jgi:hypothetical protein